MLNRGLADYAAIRIWAYERLGFRVSLSAIGRHVQQLRKRVAVPSRSDLAVGSGDPYDLIAAALELARLEVRRAELVSFLTAALSASPNGKDAP